MIIATTSGTARRHVLATCLLLSAWFLSPGDGAAQGVIIPGIPNLPQAPAQPAARSDEAAGGANPEPTEAQKANTFPIGEFFQLVPKREIGAIREVRVSREKIVKLLPLERNARAVKAVGVRVGTATITMEGANQAQEFIVNIVPSLDLVQTLLDRQFPLANLKLSAARDNVIIVEGVVESPQDVAPIENFIRGVLGKDSSAIFAIKVAGVMQVQLEVCIARVDRTALRRMGVNLLQADTNGFLGSRIGNLAGVPTIVPRGGGAAGGSAVITNFTSGSPSVLTPESTVFFGITPERSAAYAFIESLKQQSLAKILATPTLVTLNGRPADFLVGGEQPVPILNGLSVTPSVEFKPFGTRLTFVPVVLGAGKLRLDIIPEVSRPIGGDVGVGGTFNVPRFEVQRIHCTVEIDSGQTLALGGLLQVEENAEVDRVPILGEIPYLGTLFRRIRHEQREFELLILATPRLVEPLKGCQRPTQLPGQEAHSPSDCELYLKGMIESPRQQPLQAPLGALPGYQQTPADNQPPPREQLAPPPRVLPGAPVGVLPQGMQPNVTGSPVFTQPARVPSPAAGSPPAR